MYCYRLLTLLCLLLSPGWIFAHDSGVGDAFRIEATSIKAGISSPIVISLANDSAMVSWGVCYLLQSLDSSFVIIDSVRFVGRLADPTVKPMPILNQHADGITPDTLILRSPKSMGMALPPGDGPILELFLTGNKPGFIQIDTNIAGNTFSYVFKSPP